MRLSEQRTWDSAPKILPKTKRNPISEPSHLLFSPWAALPAVSSEPDIPANSLGRPHPALSPISPGAQNSCAARGIRASPSLSHNGVPPNRGGHCTASALWLAPGHRQAGQAWGKGLSGCQGGPCKGKGWAQGGRTEGHWEVRS